MEGATEVVFWVIVAIKDKVFNPFLTTKPAGGKGLGLASPLVTTSSSSTMAGLLRSIDSLANSPSSGSFCRVFPNPPRLEIRHWG